MYCVCTNCLYILYKLSLFHTDPRDAVESALTMLRVALTVDSGSKVVKVRTGPTHKRPQPVTTSIEQVNQMPLPVALFEGIKQEAFVHLVLAHYRNQLLHLFLVEGLVALSLRRNGRTGGHYTAPISKSMSLNKSV